ncbi:MAG TPA: hypothetical protein PLJ27_03685 [Polyangiaceae bacterium]|jgi:hypothetical protein|nr:MAG: hypothetical protein BWY17_03823 [Deltaproteobacteria bacterium ADurb.Bin207]HNS98538.1 hypothetical protein [Polyangiaceae bacterium]HNZ21443.1 hypothetical protein [Polyangiaceae bacterium]HOD23760.1 hypothetical protein [Polyangiaceae bacterium]HOE51185.1 hypothetical protein [Polyangiaceae bacterium]
MHRITVYRWMAAPCTLLAAATAHAQQDVADESFASAHQGQIQLGTGRASLGFGLFTTRTLTGKQEVGGRFTVEIPFGRLWARSASLPHVSQEQSPSPKETTTGHRNPPRMAVRPALARACVRAAWQAHGIGDLEAIDAMRTRAKSSALLPDARFRVVRDWDQSYRLSPTNDDPYRLHESTGGGRTVEGVLTWRLSRLLFVDEELSMERLRVQQVQLRSRLAGEVLRALFDWQRARLALADPSLDEPEHLEAAVREVEAVATLDILTGGWFSSWLGRGDG